MSGENQTIEAPSFETMTALCETCRLENERLHLEIQGYRMREQVAKQANDEMRAQLAKVRAELAHVIDVNETEAAIDAEEKRKLRSDLAARSGDLPPVLHGKLVRAGTFEAGGETVTGFVIACSLEHLRALPSLPMYQQVRVEPGDLPPHPDTERLDTYEKMNREGIRPMATHRASGFCWEWRDKTYPTFRAAIDAARAQEGGAE